MQIMIISNAAIHGKYSEYMADFSLQETEDMVNKFIEDKKVFDIKHNINFNRNRPVHYFTILYEE